MHCRARKQAIGFLLAIEHPDAAAMVLNQARLLQLSGGAHEKGHPDDVFVAHQGNFGLRALAHHVQQRTYRIGREIDMAQHGAGLIQRLAQRQGAPCP